MKKVYESPLIEIERFLFEDLLTASGIGTGDGVPDTLDSDEPQDALMME